MGFMDAFGTTGKWHDDVIRVVEGDDAALLRRRLVIVLENEPDIDVVAEAPTASRPSRWPASSRPMS
jgi:hypothetical protein